LSAADCVPPICRKGGGADDVLADLPEARGQGAAEYSNKRLVRSCRYSLLPVLATGCEKTLRSVANQLFLSSSSQQQRYSLMAVKNHRATQQQAC
jgi:hypothetical protein